MHCFSAMHSAALALLAINDAAYLKEQGSLFQVAVEKSRGNLSGAIELLRKYIDTYMLDKAAWEELGELYLQVRILVHAVFAAEFQKELVHKRHLVCSAFCLHVMSAGFLSLPAAAHSIHLLHSCLT